MTRAGSLWATTAAVLLAIGCKGADDDVEPAFVPKPVAFEGDADRRYAGDWSDVAGLSRLSLRKDGTALIEAATMSAGGKAVSRYDGRWLVSGDNLLLRYADASHQDTTLKYAAKLAGGKLALKHGGTTTIYTRK